MPFYYAFDIVITWLNMKDLIIHFITAFSSMVEGKNEAMSTSELSGGARIHYIFQSIFVKSLEVPTFILII